MIVISFQYSILVSVAKSIDLMIGDRMTYSGPYLWLLFRRCSNTTVLYTIIVGNRNSISNTSSHHTYGTFRIAG